MGTALTGVLCQGGRLRTCFIGVGGISSSGPSVVLLSKGDIYQQDQKTCWHQTWCGSWQGPEALDQWKDAQWMTARRRSSPTAVAFAFVLLLGASRVSAVQLDVLGLVAFPKGPGVSSYSLFCHSQ